MTLSRKDKNICNILGPRAPFQQPDPGIFVPSSPLLVSTDPDDLSLVPPVKCHNIFLEQATTLVYHILSIS
jgi:hypothetical protein